MILRVEIKSKDDVWEKNLMAGPLITGSSTPVEGRSQEQVGFKSQLRFSFSSSVSSRLAM